MARYRIRFDRPWSFLFAVFGAGARHSELAVSNGVVLVRLGLLFRTRIPLDHVLAAEARLRFPRWSGIGVHALGRGRVVANGSRHGTVRLVLDRVPARIGPVRVHLRELWLSVEGRDEFLAAVRGGGPDDLR